MFIYITNHDGSSNHPIRTPGRLRLQALFVNHEREAEQELIQAMGWPSTVGQRCWMVLVTTTQVAAELCSFAPKVREQ